MSTRTRLLRHGVLFIGISSLVVLGQAVFGTPGKPYVGWSMATAYASMLLLLITLSIGPWIVFQGRRLPVSRYLRRDLGIWAGITSLAHLVLGLQVHMGGDFLRYFFHQQGGEWRPYFNLFGLANYSGILAGLLLLLLLLLSNNASLRLLGKRRWKGWQRMLYPGMLLILLHGFSYQLIEKREMVWVALLILLALSVIGVQLAGYRRYRARNARFHRGSG